MKGFVIEIVDNGEVRYLDPDKFSRAMDTETERKVLFVTLSEYPVGMEEGAARLLASELPVSVDAKVKSIRDVDLEKRG